MRAAESWLSSDDHDKFAAAAVKCQHAGAFCMADGWCHRDGDCFRSDKQAANAAIWAIRRAADKEPRDIASLMLLAADLLRQDMTDTPTI